MTDFEPIDFVIPWVDGADQAWIDQKVQYLPNEAGVTDAHIERYRDWDNLQYFFRGVEAFAPWVHTIFFITWGHIPEWLNLKHPKLHVVRHADYIPSEYLPTFSSNTIELNLHRIEGLSEHFVYFNDDFFLIAPTVESDFFEGGLPKETAGLNVHCYTHGIVNQMLPINDVGVINKHFDIKQTVRGNLGKWLNPKYGTVNLRTFVLMMCPRFPGFYQTHLATSFCKSTFEEVWAAEPDVLETTSARRFRDERNNTQWLFKEWQLVKGEFAPRANSFGRSFYFDRDGLGILQDVSTYIRRQKGKMIAINDGPMSPDEFEQAKAEVNAALDFILPEKCSFELD